MTRRMQRQRATAAGALLLALLGACSPAGPEAGGPRPLAVEDGLASWYGPGFEGRPTASGERFDPDELTAAHRTLPFGTRVRVRNLENGREVIVRINDRGPGPRARIIDVSRAAAERLRMIDAGVVRVRVFVEEPGVRER